MKQRCAIGILTLLLLCGLAGAETRTYVIAIGNNAPPPAAAGDDELRALRYADDDAAAFFSFTRDLSFRSTLLTVLDKDSQRRFPDLAALSHVPTLAELRRVVNEYRALFEQDLRAGHDPVLLFFYSGHGSRAGRAPSLTLEDAPLTQEVLYDEILARLPARYVHLLVDACYAEAVVRPRDVQAEVVNLTPREQQSYAARSTLARFPNVGALVASSEAAQAHEWDVYERGVFSHELLSGLRGAADIDGNGRIEYSELYAFLAAANRGVADPRAHLEVVAHPPSVNRRAPIVDLGGLRHSGRLVGEAYQLGWFHVEDGRGNRIADVFAEPGFKVSVSVPADTEMFVSNRRGEAAIRVGAGGRLELHRVALRAASIARRGALSQALQRGLFTAPFGPTYYRGFVDQNQELVPVPSPDNTLLDLSAKPARDPSVTTAQVSFGVAGALVIATAIFGGLTYQAYRDWTKTEFQRPANDALNRFSAYQWTTVGTAAGGGLAAALGTVLWVRTHRPARLLPRAAIGPGFAALGAELHF